MTERFELIEAYSMNKLSASESAAFEVEMAKDPALKNEVELQKDIISSIQNSRKTELKNRLASLEVKPGYTLLQKVGVGAVALSALLFLSYNLIEDDTTGVIEEKTTNKVNSIVVEEEISNKGETPSKAIEETEVVTRTETVVSDSQLDTPVSNNVPEKTNAETTSSRPEDLVTVQVPVLSSDDEIVSHDKVGSPSSFEGTQEDDEIKGIIPSFESKNKKHRQYKYDGENLTLIGNFNSEEPYFLIEKPSEASTEMYLKFENTFYAIKETKKATDLEEVTNKSMIQELSKK